jgi:aspartate kinase
VIRGDKFSKSTESRIVARIKRELLPDSVMVTRNYAILMVVGEGMAFSAGMLAKATASLAEHGINISMVNQGASEYSFMIGIKSEDRVKAVRALYSAYFG